MVVGYGTLSNGQLTDVEFRATAVENKGEERVVNITGTADFTNQTPTSTVKIRTVEGQLKPLYVINGKVTFLTDLKQLSPNNIETIHVIKGTNAVARYGPQGTNGVIEIITKDAAAPASVPVNLSDNLCDADAVIIIDDKKVDCKEATIYMKKNKDRIATVNVFKGTANVKKGTGQDAKNAIVIRTKAD